MSTEYVALENDETLWQAIMQQKQINIKRNR